MAVAAVAVVPGALVALTACEGSNDHSGPWPADAAAVVVTSGSDSEISFGPEDERTLLIVGTDGVAAAYPGIGAQVLSDIGRDLPSEWASLEAVASDAQAVLVSVSSPTAYAAPVWGVWSAATGETVAVTCGAEPSDIAPVLDVVPGVAQILDVGPDTFTVLGGCGPDPTVASIDARTGEIADGEPVGDTAGSVWDPAQSAWVVVDGAPGPCVYGDRLADEVLVVACYTDSSLVRYGAVTLDAETEARGTYAPLPEIGDNEHFYFTALFVRDNRVYANANTPEGTPLLITESPDEYWMTALAPVGDRLLMGRGLDPFGPGDHEPQIGWYDPDSAQFEELPFARYVDGDMYSAWPLPIG